jgi:hypothetical protein
VTLETRCGNTAGFFVLVSTMKLKGFARFTFMNKDKKLIIVS